MTALKRLKKEKRPYIYYILEANVVLDFSKASRG